MGYEDSDSGRFQEWHDFIGRDLDPDIAAMPVLRYNGAGSERLLLQAVRHLKALRGMVEHKSNHRDGE
jgi:hypothetical protein